VKARNGVSTLPGHDPFQEVVENELKIRLFVGFRRDDRRVQVPGLVRVGSGKTSPFTGTMDRFSVSKPEKLGISSDRGDTGTDYSVVDELPGNRGCRPRDEVKM